MSEGPNAECTLRELDERCSCRKGTAFRAFKRALAAQRLVEERDFQYLSATEDAEQIARLRSADRIYPSSINVVLLSSAGCRQVQALMATLSPSKHGNGI